VAALDSVGAVAEDALFASEADMKRVLLLAFAMALICAGVYMLMSTVAHPSLFGIARGGFGAVVWIGLGGFLLWDDFLKPLAVKRWPHA
jgi:hypothetical protein